MWTFSDLCAMVYVVEIGVIPNFQENKQGAFAPDIYLGGKTMDTKILEKNIYRTIVFEHVTDNH